MLAPLTDGDPRQVGRYRLHGRLGAGGMGVVYQGFSPEGRPVAIKLPHEEFADDDEFRVRFRQEVMAAQRIHGTFVAEVLDADVDADRPWMATEYVDGVSLADGVRGRGPLEGATLTSLAVGLADALVAIHAADVVHRDLKPANVIMAWDGPKVIDFGIARTSDSSVRTSTGVLVGTAAWMAPEQLSGQRAGPTADIFAWGACVAYAATGRNPFAADTPAAAIGRILGGEPDLDGLPAELSNLVRQALAKVPEARPRATDIVATLAGRELPDSAAAGQVATRIVHGAQGGPAPQGSPAPHNGYTPYQQLPPIRPAHAGAPGPGGPWPGWQTPPTPGVPASDPRGSQTPSPHQPPQQPPQQGVPWPQQGTPWPQHHPGAPWPQQQAGVPGNTTPPPAPPAAPPAASGAAPASAPAPAPAPGRAAWFGQSTPIPLPLRITIAIAAVLAAIPVVFRAPELLYNARSDTADVWRIYHEFGIVFLALPIALAVLAAGNRYGPLRDAAAGTALGLAVAAAAELGTMNQFAVRSSPGQDAGVTAGAGWWLLTVAALAAVIAILGWRGLSDRWSPGLWAAAAAGVVAVAVLLVVPSPPAWQQSSGQDATSIIVAAVVVGVLGVATFVSHSGAAHFFIVLAAAGICVLELAAPAGYDEESTFVAGSAAILVGYLVLGLACNRFSGRLFLLTARIGIAVAYLRIGVFPTIEALDEIDFLYTVAFGMIVFLAALAARAKPPRPSWPTPYGYQPYGTQPYGTQPYGYYGHYQHPYPYPHQPR